MNLRIQRYYKYRRYIILMIAVTDEQQAIIHSKSPLIKINAITQSGKTFVAIQKCMQLLKQSNERLKILFLVHNEQMRVHLRKDMTYYCKHYFGQYRYKSMLSLIQIHTTQSYANELFRTQIGSFTPMDFIPQDIGSFLYSQYQIRLTTAQTEQIHRRLYRFYNSLNSIHDEIKEALEGQLAEQKAHLATIYDGVIKIVQAQLKLDFVLPAKGCLKLVSTLDMPHIFYNIMVIDEAQDTNPLLLKIFLQLKAPYKLLIGDSYQHISSDEYSDSCDALAVTKGFTIYQLTRSFLAKEVASRVYQILSKLGNKNHFVGIDHKMMTNQEGITSNPYTFISRHKITLLEQLYKDAKAGKRIFVMAGFIDTY